MTRMNHGRGYTSDPYSSAPAKRHVEVPDGLSGLGTVPSVPYQIDFTSQWSGRHIAPSKLLATFKFGFANPLALLSGESGPACRGSEHTVNLTWSGVSGRRKISVDGKDVHVGVSGNRAAGRFETSFPLRNNVANTDGRSPDHQVHLVAYYAPLAGEKALAKSRGKKFRQFDLTVDGQSCHDMLKIFELGGDEWGAAHRGGAFLDCLGAAGHAPRI